MLPWSLILSTMVEMSPPAVIGDFGHGRSRERCRGGAWYVCPLIEVDFYADIYKPSRS